MQLLTEQGVNFTTIEYLKEPPTADELETLCTMLGVEPLSILRTKEARFADLGLSTDDDRPPSEWFALMVENPVLIERPIVVIDGKAVIGRPPENINMLLVEGA